MIRERMRELLYDGLEEAERRLSRVQAKEMSNRDLRELIGTLARYGVGLKLEADGGSQGLKVLVVGALEE